jgi:L-fucose/D-arabinose isomerase
MAMKRRVGLLTFSDGREYLHEEYLPITSGYEARMKSALEATGEVEVVRGAEIVWNNETAVAESKRLREAGVELTIFNYAIWCYPHLTAICSNFAPGPHLLFCNIHPGEPGMVGMLAAAGALDQLGRSHERLWGDISESEVLAKVMAFVNTASAISRLKGQTFGLFGGRPLGMYTAVSNLDQWQKDFGLDVEHIEQQDIVRYSKLVESAKVEKALAWLDTSVGEIKYDDSGLTKDKLKDQIRSYYALRRIIAERRLDFIGIKAHGDLTDTFVTMDIAEAFLNDPYDWDGPHEPIVASTEADMDGALTMQFFKLITGKPVLFADVRHYDKVDDVWYFSNSGTHATFFAGGSSDPAKNLKNVTFYPEKNYYPAGGASVHHFAAPGEVTLARFARSDGRYKLTVVPATFVEFPRQIALEKGSTVTREWPIAFARLRVSPEYFLSNYPCNHIHGVYGNHTAELLLLAKLLGIEATLFDGEAR